MSDSRVADPKAPEGGAGAAGPAVPPPGATLREAREARGWSAAELAGRLRLAARVVERLEADAWDELPGATYVRGYIRAYAVAVGLDPAPLVAAYDRHAGPGREPAVVAPPARGPRRGPERAARWMSLAIALVFAALVLVWWIDRGTPLPAGNGHDRGAGVVPQPVESAAREETAPGAPAVVSARPERLPETPPAVPPAGAGPGSGEAEADQESGPAAGPGTPGEAAPARSPAAGREVRPPSLAGTEAAPPEAGEAVPAGEPNRVAVPTPVGETAVPAEPAAAGPALEVVLSFSEDSWVEVRRSSGKALVLRVAHAGDRLEVQGAPPLKLVLGNAPAARLWVDGREVDLRPFTRRRIVRAEIRADGLHAAPRP